MAITYNASQNKLIGGYGEDGCTKFPIDRFENRVSGFELVKDNKVFDDELVTNKIYDLRDLILQKHPELYPGMMSEDFLSTFLTKDRRNETIIFLKSNLMRTDLSETTKRDLDFLIKSINKISLRNDFETYMSLSFYLNLRDKKTNITEGVVFSYDTSILEVLIDYIKYDLNKKPNIQYFQPNKPTSAIGLQYIVSQEILNRNHIKINHLNDLSIANIDETLNTNFPTKVRFIVIDTVISVGSQGDSYIYRLTYAFQMIFSLLYIAINILEINGDIHIVMPPMGKKFIFDMMMTITQMFDNFEYYDVPYICHNDHQLLNNIYVFNGFRGINHDIMAALQNLIRIYQEIDQNNGYDFVPNQPEYPKSLSLTQVDNYYLKYKKWLSNKIQLNIDQIIKFNDTISNITRAELVARIKMAYINTPIVAKKLGLEIVKWFGNSDKYFTDIIRLLEETTIEGILKIISYQKTNITHNQNFDFKIHELVHMSDIVYQYVDKLSSKVYAKSELYFNKYYKNLNRMLATKYGIMIGSKYVTRAWMKMFEILTLTNFFDNFSEKIIDGFQICEAPGNFIASITYYLGRSRIKYNWNAQSLKIGLQDDYGMMRDYPNQWDFGIDGTGDITNYNNLVYYVDTYGQKDIFVGDCGEKWNDTTLVFAAYQLIYALLIVKPGGNFIIKTFAGNTNKLFLNLLELAARSFNKLCYYKSYINFWSHEIYICGKNYFGIDDQLKNKLFETMKTLDVDIIDITNNISDQVFENYYKYSMQIIHVASIYKNFFVFCADNPEYIQKNDSLIRKIINRKNDKWIERFIPQVKH